MSQVSSIKNFESLCNDMKNGKINNLIILGANPVYDSPVDFDFAESLKKVKNSVHLTNIIDETSKLCSWNIAMNHYFECWGDAMTYDGYVSIVQPQIMPLFDSKSIIQVLSPIVHSKEQSAYDTVKNDLNCCLEVINSNGTVLCDDYNLGAQAPEVKIAIDEFVENNSFKCEILCEDRFAKIQKY